MRYCIVILLALIFTSCSGNGATSSVSLADNATPASPELTAYLTTELNKQLSEISYPEVQPPFGANNAVADLSANSPLDSTARFMWTYTNTGDYNLDGIVDIYDITPIGRFWGRPVGLTNDTAPKLVDGSGNGLIDIYDLQAIAANFHTNVAYYEVQGLIAYEPTIQWRTIKSVPFTDASEGFSSLHFTQDFSSDLGDVKVCPEFRVVPFDKNGVAGIPSNVIDRTSLVPQLSSMMLTDELGNVKNNWKFNVGDQVTFIAETTGADNIYISWDFSGGVDYLSQYGFQVNTVVITMLEPGTYTLNLGVWNNFGRMEYTFPYTIVAQPVASIHIQAVNPQAGPPQVFNGPFQTLGTWNITTDATADVMISRLQIGVSSNGPMLLTNLHLINASTGFTVMGPVDAVQQPDGNYLVDFTQAFATFAGGTGQYRLLGDVRNATGTTLQSYITQDMQIDARSIPDDQPVNILGLPAVNYGTVLPTTLTVTQSPTSTPGGTVSPGTQQFNAGTWAMVAGSEDGVVPNRIIIQLDASDPSADFNQAVLWADDGVNPAHMVGASIGVGDGKLDFTIPDESAVGTTPYLYTLKVGVRGDATIGHQFRAVMEQVVARSVSSGQTVTIVPSGLPCALNLFTIQ